MKRQFLIFGALFGLLAVAFGAMGAHALKNIISAEALGSFETAVRYQMYHALLLVFLSNIPSIQSKTILYSLVAGVFLFSFSIYLLSLRSLIGLEGLKILGPITPVGGLLLMFGWANIFIKAVKINR